MPAAVTCRRAGFVAALALAMGAGLVPARSAGAQDGAAAAKPWYQELAVNGFVTTSYSYNFNRPGTRQNTLRVFDFDDNTFKVDEIELVVQHPAARPREAGFRVDLSLGGSVPRVTASVGLFRDSLGGPAEDIDLHQVFASYVVPVGSGLRVDAGKFITHHGAEVIEGYDAWNDNATRSLLFGYAIPFTHTGVRASYAFGAKLAAMAMVVNGWDNATDNNTAKTVGVQLSMTPTPSFALTVNGMTGPERTNENRDRRSLLDATASIRAARRLTLGVNLDYGAEEGLPSSAAGPAEWSGIAGYARCQATERFALAARAESFRDQDGVRTGTSQTLSEVTFTPELRVSPHFVLRGDLRTDWSTKPVFLRDSRPVDTQTTLLVNALAVF